MNREFLQLAKIYNPVKHGPAGWFLSEKLDGQRALWDGGLSRGVPLHDVPWAQSKLGQGTATGLWSRYGRPIIAPDWWLDQLPPFPLDGELYLGPGSFQQLVSITKRTVNLLETEWLEVKYYVFDAPPYEQIFMEGRINNNIYKKIFGPDVLAWVKRRLIIEPPFIGSFEGAQKMLKKEIRSKVIVLHDQERLPFKTDAARERIAERMELVVASGGEGLMLRNPVMPWFPKRNDNILKIKPYLDGSGTVVGYKMGKGKYLGMLGSLVLDTGFDLSGFTDAERTLVGDLDWARSHPGELGINVRSLHFPLGCTVEYLYRELTDSGLPKEARYFRRN